MKTLNVLTMVVMFAAGAPAAGVGAVDAATGVGQSQWRGGRVDQMIERAFDDVLRRRPDEREVRRYRLRVEEDYWNEEDIKADLRARSDYRNHNERSRGRGGSYDVDRVIRSAYQDILGRDPDPQGLREYRRKMVEQGWTERQVRDALRESPEHARNPGTSADRIVRRAYQDLLGREPDASGLASYRNQIIHHGWDEHDVRDALMKSPEYRQKNAMTADRAREIVRRAYLSVLGREPDTASEGYVQRVLRDHWSERDVARELRNSEEYRRRR